jgi:hypothetical protein
MASRGKGLKRNNDNERKTKAVAAGVLPSSNNELIDAQELTMEADPASPSSKKSKKNRSATTRTSAKWKQLLQA